MITRHRMALNSPAVSFLAIIPLAKVFTCPVVPISVCPNRALLQLFAFATEELSIRVGETLAGLLNATLVRPPPSLYPSSGSTDSQDLVFVYRATRELFPEC